jgi:hypothetical protein
MREEHTADFPIISPNMYYLARIIGLLAKVMREEHTADFVIIMPILSPSRPQFITSVYSIFYLILFPSLAPLLTRRPASRLATRGELANGTSPPPWWRDERDESGVDGLDGGNVVHDARPAREYDGGRPSASALVVRVGNGGSPPWRALPRRGDPQRTTVPPSAW